MLFRSYEFNYTPSKDIKNDTTIEVRYGLMAGLDPSRALIFSLQALGADLVSKDFIRRELPWALNVTAEEQRIEIEKMRENLSAALISTAQAIPQLAGQGGDPSPLIRNIADIIERRRKGEPIETAALAVFTPPQPPAQQGSPTMAPAGTQAPVEQMPPSPGAPETAPAGAPTPPAAQQPQSLDQILAGIRGA